MVGISNRNEYCVSVCYASEQLRMQLVRTRTISYHTETHRCENRQLIDINHTEQFHFCQ